MSKLFSLIFSALLFVFVALFPQPAHAGYLDLIGSDPSETFKQGLEAEGMNYPQFGTYALQSTIQGLTKFLIGYPALEGEPLAYGAQGSLATAIAQLYTHQPSSVEYLAYAGQRLNLIKPTYAATGEGWNFLDIPTLKIWTKFRDVAYLLFVVIFVVIGMMIMFRAKLNPQTVINIQLALPRIVVALILVTFSYALSGLMVDIVFLGNGLIKNIVASKTTGNLCGTTGDQERMVFENPDVTWQQDCATLPEIYTPSVWPLHILDKYGGGEGIAEQLLKGLANVFIGAFNGTFWNALFQLVIASSVVGATFKIFFSLLTKYVMIILNVITMPLAIAFSALSGQSNPLKPLKELLANTISFPVTSFLLALAYYFASSVSSTQDLPPLYMQKISGTAGYAATTGTAVAASMVAIGILMAIPTILASIDQAFEAKPLTQGATEQISNMMRKLPIIGGMMG